MIARASCWPFWSRQSNSDIALQDFISGIPAELLVAGAEANYIAGTSLSYLVDFDKALPSHMPLGLSLGWNYADAICAIGLGLQQLLGEQQKYKMRTKAKGLLNIISGVQLFLLSYNPPLTLALGIPAGVTLAAPSFALAMGIDLVTAAIDFYTAYEELNEANQAAGSNSGTGSCSSYTANSGVSPDVANICKSVTDAKAAYHQAKYNLALKAASFVGMTLLAVSTFVACPPVFFVGLAITSVVAGFYLKRNAPHVIRSISAACTFFGDAISTLNESSEREFSNQPVCYMDMGRRANY